MQSHVPQRKARGSLWHSRMSSAATFRRVALWPEWKRGGLLRQGSVLMATSYATRTSPTIRGAWVLENILGTPPPPPPPNVPTIDEKGFHDVDGLSFRDSVGEASIRCMLARAATT